MNLITDGLPALALGVDPKDPNAMDNPPRDPNEPIFNKHLISSILLAGIVVGIGTLTVFFYELDLNLDPSFWIDETSGTIYKAQTMAFTVLIIFQKFMAFSSRHETESLFKVGVFKNKFLVIVIILTFTLHLGVIYLDFFHDIFGTVPLNGEDWIIIFGVSSSVLMFEEIRKFIFRKVESNNDSKPVVV